MSEEGKKQIRISNKMRTQHENQEIPPEKPSTAKPGIMTDLIALLLRILWIGLFLVIIFYFVFGITVNRGTRMAPAFHDRDVVIYYRLAHQIVAGDTVVYTGVDGEPLLGRVVAIPGDSVNFTEEGLKVNGYSRINDYGTGDTILYEEGPGYPLALSEGQFFVLCDDRTQGNDSRLIGPLSGKQIKGRVMLSVRQRDF